MMKGESPVSGIIMLSFFTQPFVLCAVGLGEVGRGDALIEENVAFVDDEMVHQSLRCPWCRIAVGPFVSMLSTLECMNHHRETGAWGLISS